MGVLVWLATAIASPAAVLSWSGGGGADANWNNSANWGYVGTPANGDTLIFSAGQPNLLNTNNLLGLALNQVRFVGAGGGYDIRGNVFTISDSIEATNSAGANIIENPISLIGANRMINVVSSLTLSGAIMGPAGVTKNGAGTLTFAGALSNTYGGTTTVNGGLLQLSKNGVMFAATAIPGDLVIGNSSGPAVTVRNTFGLEIADTANVTVYTNATWDLNGNTDTIGTHLTFSGGGIVAVGAGTLTLTAPNVISMTGAAQAQITGTGTLQLGTGPCQMDVSGAYLDIFLSIQGTAAISKTGTGTVMFRGNNTYAGQTVISQGRMWAMNSQALGATNGDTVVNAGATLVLDGGITVTNEVLTLSGPASSMWATLDCETSETNTWAGPIVLNNDASFGSYHYGTLRVVGSISGPGAFIQKGSGNGTVSLEGTNANTYAGATVVQAGTLVLGKTAGSGYVCAVPNALIISNDCVVRLDRSYQIYHPYRSTAFTTTLYPGSLLDLNGNAEWLAQVSMNASEIDASDGNLYLSGDITVASNLTAASTIHGTMELFAFNAVTNNTINIPLHARSPDLAIDANIVGAGTNSLIKAGNGELQLFGTNNSFAGETIVAGGLLAINFTNGLGNTNMPATVKTGGSLLLNNNVVVGLKPLILNGDGYAFGALAGFGTSAWAGNITLASDTTINSFLSGYNLTLSGAIGGPGALTKNGAGTVTLGGSAANTYSGVTRVSNGTLALAKGGFDSAVPHDLIINGTVLYQGNNQVANTADVTVNGILNINGLIEGLGTITGNGTIALGTGLLDMYDTTDCVFGGIISGTGAVALQQRGTATLTLNGNNTYTGITRAISGKLVVNGSQPQSAMQVDGAGTLGGSGIIGTLAANGLISPGNSPGVLTTSNITFTGTGSLRVELNGPNPGPGGYDQLSVRGSNNLAGASLTLLPVFTTPVGPGQKFTILNNIYAGATNIGTFAGLPEGASMNINNYGFTISYVGGSGNDVVLTLTNVPVGLAGYSVGLGNGSGTIDPNECNSLNVVITNKTGAAMTGISAALQCITPNVAVTQPYASYPNVPANGMGTNLVQFQLSTGPNFVCGSDIKLQLCVTTTSHGSFIVPVTLATGAPALNGFRWDVNTVTNIPDIGTIESTNTAIGFSGQLVKVVVAVWITHPVVSDLSLWLISPDGITVPLVLNSGNGANFGAACVSRTYFDDASGLTIAGGTSPYIGYYRPQGSLAAFNHGTANGNWRLRITDSIGGSLGALRCWSLFLYPVACNSGGGLCNLCPNTTIMGATGAGSPTQAGYIAFDENPSVCGVSKACPGTIHANPLPADTYTFRNGPSDACITVTAENYSDSGAMVVAAYSGIFDPASTNRCLNYLGDPGFFAEGGNPIVSFSFNVASNATFSINVLTELLPYLPYRLTVSGGDCRPELNITPVAANKVKLDWTTAAGGYRLESTNRLGASSATWPVVTNGPVVINGRCTVTNTGSSGGQFYRLHKP